MTALAVPIHYELTHEGLAARITRRDLDGGPALVLDAVDGVWTVGIDDPTLHSRHRLDAPPHVDIRATFPIGDDLDGALEQVSAYAIAICELMARHRTGITVYHGTLVQTVADYRGAFGGRADGDTPFR